MAKQIHNRPEWLKSDVVDDIYSVSGCISKEFAEYINYWQHNGYWFFNSIKVIETLATEKGIDLSNTTLFYYEVYEKQYDDKRKWIDFEPEPSFDTCVVNPASKQLEGFDIVSFSAGTSAECSPLSCNNLAQETKVNEHCLFDIFDDAIRHLEKGAFFNSEPGPYRVFAVYTV